MQRAGFEVLAAVDVNAQAVATLRSNLAEARHPDLIRVRHALVRDLTTYSPSELSELIGAESVDVIVGGPPCQGFSTARQVDGSNHGTRLAADPRRLLYREFLRFVDWFQPKAFVIENVLGIRSAAGGDYFTRVQKEGRGLGRNAGRPGYRVHSQIEDAWELGVPQKRRRQLIIGVRNDLPGYFLPAINRAPRALPCPTLSDAIFDLPVLRAGSGENERNYDHIRRAKFYRMSGPTGRNFLHNVLEIHLSPILRNHVARPHSDRDLRDFRRLNEGESSAIAMRERGVQFEFPYKKTSFKDRYTRQSRWQPCSTIVAHLSKDGLMFIHPTQNRSLTPREAARVQSFPDWFKFPESRTQAFRMIGNAVPPLVAEAVGLTVKSFVMTRPSIGGPTLNAGPPTTGHLPPIEAVRALESLLRLDRKALRTLTTAELLRGWHALLELFPALHPDNARDHGETVEPSPEAQLVLPGLESVMHQCYERSGWPVALVLIGEEVTRRYDSSSISADDFYWQSRDGSPRQRRICSELQTANELADVNFRRTPPDSLGARIVATTTND